MATAGPKETAPVERLRKKPRLSLSSTSTAAPNTSTAAASTAAAATATSGPVSRLKSGLPLPSVNTSRLHYAFGSRIGGKENVVNASAKPPSTTLNSSSSKHHSEPVKKKPSEPTDANPIGAKSALNRRPKRRVSLLPPLGEATESTATGDAAAEKSQRTSAPTTPAPVNGSDKNLATTSTSTAAAVAEKELLSTPSAKAHSEPAPLLQLSPVKPVRFEVTSATDPDFWKCRQDFARSAMAELKALEQRLVMLSKRPSSSEL